MTFFFWLLQRQENRMSLLMKKIHFKVLRWFLYQVRNRHPTQLCLILVFCPLIYFLIISVFLFPSLSESLLGSGYGSRHYCWYVLVFSPSITILFSRIFSKWYLTSLTDIINVGFGTFTRGYTAASLSSAALHSHLPDCAGCNGHPLSDSDFLCEHKEESKILHPEFNSFVYRALLQLLLADCRWEKMTTMQTLVCFQSSKMELIVSLNC